LVLDAQLGLDQQDLNLVSLAVKNGKGLVILVNKWDLMAKETNTARNFELQIKEKLQPFDDVPIIFTSAIEKQLIQRAVEIAKEYNEREGVNFYKAMPEMEYYRTYEPRIYKWLLTEK
jgi:GTP-binding protein